MKFNSQGLLLLQGDVLEVLGTLPDESVHCCVTSPPYYGLRSYGVPPSIWGGSADCEHEWGSMERGKRKDILPEDTTTLVSRIGVDERQNGAGTNGGRFCVKCGAWLGCFGLEPTPQLYVEHVVAIFREVRRVLRSDGCAYVNLGDSYAHDGKRGGETGGKQAYLPEADRKRAGRERRYTGLASKNLLGIPWKVAFALQDDGWYLRSGMPWVRRAAMPDSTQDRPGSVLEYVFLLAKSERYYFDMEAVRRAPSGISGGAKFGKVSLDGPGSRECTAEDRERYATQGRQWRNADLWFESVDAPHGLCGMGDELVGIDVNPRGFKGAHFATFPEALIRPLIRAGSSDNGCCGACGAPRVRQVEDRGNLPPVDYEGKNALQDKQHSARRMLANVRAAREAGADHDNPFPPKTTVGWEPSCDCQPASESPCIVLDPFLGSGTTALVSRDLGRRCIGIELNPAYLEMARERVKQGVLPL